jgi:hypothetical protein
MVEAESPETAAGATARGHLRLVWSNPAPRPLPQRALNLAAAIEQQLSGEYGMSDDDFARVFARTACAGGGARTGLRVL